MDVPHPDLFFVRSERVGMRGVRGWEEVPDLIIEVLSPSTASDHRPGGRWWRAYERNGIPHYWLVDTQRHVIFQYALAGEPYANGNYHEPATLSGNDLLESALFPTISVAVSEIFRHIGGEPSRRLSSDG